MLDALERPMAESRVTVEELDNPDPVLAEEAFGGPVKQCRECREYLPADKDFFWKSKGARDGLLNLCKPCWYERFGEKERERLRAKKLRERSRATR